MANKLYPTNLLAQAQNIVSAWNQIGATVTLGTLLPTSLSTDITAVTALESQIAGLEAQITDARNKRVALYDGLWDKLKRVRNGVKANYGDDSSQYEMFGGTRRSDRKSPTRRAVAA